MRCNRANKSVSRLNTANLQGNLDIASQVGFVMSLRCHSNSLINQNLNDKLEFVGVFAQTKLTIVGRCLGAAATSV